MKASLSLLLLGVMALAPVPADPPESEKYVKAFPAAPEGMTRFIIQLPHKERTEEGNFQVELLAGKEIETDGVNKVFMGGTIEARPLEGWGFTYYQVKEFGPVGSTLIGVPPGTPMVKKFVPVKPLVIPYNSRVPVVVYVPKGGEVRYRIWSASEKTGKATER